MISPGNCLSLRPGHVQRPQSATPSICFFLCFVLCVSYFLFFILYNVFCILLFCIFYIFGMLFWNQACFPRRCWRRPRTRSLTSTRWLSLWSPSSSPSSSPISGDQGDEQRAEGARARGGLEGHHHQLLHLLLLLLGQDTPQLDFHTASHSQAGLPASVLVISPNTESSSPWLSVFLSIQFSSSGAQLN